MDNEQALFNIANTNKMKKGKIDNRYSGYFYIPTPKKKLFPPLLQSLIDLKGCKKIDYVF